MLVQLFKWKPKLPKVKYRKLGKEQSYGLYDGNNIIEVDERLRAKRKLEILLHETTHWQYPEMAEEDVIKRSRELTEILWKEHLRFVEKEEF
jgi:hypothetical protein